ncbi:DUF4129 domain-containing protein [Luteimonas fraxinea]|uniref:DUF4129 domain-containing protein n=1 Tax=Luteimonas fraxinea TaxID=2901869 RepID=A0ABS8UFH8_9GAMM|nr:DUF4129 domain-containing protein [Luteimonas fraxinea]MCD9098233.1 DUF4129 domain-containing protein [Luteimonas fraxinea]MCD9126964.1 DUF4129 domain-containing protein [Luteimonas fraxinea]UHH08829.1 DUF4129 domain-containing protein [Luteimonas fraxinea]
MRVETVQVELRPRTAWEAMELGNALVRRHALAIWGPSLLLGLPVFVVLNALGWAIDQLWLSALLLWWLKPVFDRVPLFVLSRAVFGAAPGMRATLDAQWRWGWRPLIGHLTWRRFSPWRAATLPVDLLEGLSGAPLAQRRRLLADGIGGHALLLTVICQLFVAALLLSLTTLVLMFVPTELLSESARAMWALISEQPPRWVQVLGNLAFWMAIGLVEPFYIGAGFGLYLNRRTQLEAWDLEIAFRRLRARLAPAATLVVGLLLAGLMLAPVSGHAQDPATAGDDGTREINPTKTWRPGERKQDVAQDDAAQTPTLPQVFGRLKDGAAFQRAIERAYADPLLDNKREVMRWQRKDADDEKEDEKSRPTPNTGLLAAIGQVFALIAEYGLWLVLAIVVGVLAWTARRWWPWMRGTLGPVREPSEIVVEAAPPPPEALPADLVSEVRRLWAEGRHRRALALLYRGGVEAMVARAGVTLVPGATEAQVLRASRRLPDAEDRDAFAEMVRVWQRAAYGQRLPDDAGLDALLTRLVPRFGWFA